MEKQAVKNLNIRIPIILWRRLKLAIVNEKIKSIQAATIEGLNLLLAEKNKK